VALSLPFQATGLFVFDYKDDLLLPFEGTGVATDWVFELPKLANRFDYGTIADVLVTIEYTALESSDYRAQVLGQLGTAFAADRAISLRYEFADLWYDLHNPDQVDVANRMKAVLDVDAASFPPNLKRLAGVSGSIPGIKVQQIQFYLVRRDGETFELPVGLKFTPQNGSQVDAGTAVTQGGLISTRQPSGSGWQAKIAGALPVGRWEFDLTGNLQSASGQASADKIQSAFQHDLVEDVLFVITFEGETLPLA